MTNQQKGHYRYDPVNLEKGGPARVFPYVGEDGSLFYIIEKLAKSSVAEGRVSEPWSLFLEQLNHNVDTLKERWIQISTLLADVEIFQSGWFNFSLPPGEQFSSPYVQQRKRMGEALIAAREAAQKARENGVSSSIPRNKFYKALEEKGFNRPQFAAGNQGYRGLRDDEFARQRLSGPNPMSLRSFSPEDQPWLQSLPAVESNLPTGEQIVNLNLAASQQRLFILDYPLLQNLQMGDLQLGRYVGSPKTLFYLVEGKLKPLLIQLESGGKVFTPTDSDNTDAWMRAKLFVQVADANQHELIEHLCYTHMAMEAFAVATPRQLPAHHPVFRLLSPHFRFLLAINARGNTMLLGENAAINQLMAPTRETCLNLINQAYRQRPFADYSLPNNLQRRGVGKDVLPDFPYRDDIQLLWSAIAKYVTSYLQNYYRSDLEVSQDIHLQAWAAELGQPLNYRSVDEFPQVPWWLPPELVKQADLNLTSLPNHPRVPSFPHQDTTQHPSGKISSLQELIDIATQIIFTCGPQHAAVNFNQFDYMGYVPDHPFAAYTKPELATSVKDILPPLEQEIGQMGLTFALSAIRWGQLGSEDLIKFDNRQDCLVLQQFQADLNSIETEIKQRNQQRLAKDGVDYPYLLPSRIPNSINI